MRLANGASQLHAIRLRGKCPTPHVVVTDQSFIARLNASYGVFCLIAGPGVWDMRCLHGLEVIVWCYGDDLLGLVESIALAEPSELRVMDKAKQRAMLDWLAEQQREAA